MKLSKLFLLALFSLAATIPMGCGGGEEPDSGEDDPLAGASADDEGDPAAGGEVE